MQKEYEGTEGSGTVAACLFDFGGVLTSPVWDTFSSFCRAEGLDPDSIKQLFRKDPGALEDLRKLEAGQIEPEAFEKSFGDRLGVADARGLIDRLFENMNPEEEMLSAVGAIKAAGIKTGLVSNSWRTDQYDRAMLDGMFDDVVISGEVGMHKPNPDIYLLAAERLEVDPASCVFIDDLRENCHGAEAVGMQAVRHRETEGTLLALQSLTGVSLLDS